VEMTVLHKVKSMYTVGSLVMKIAGRDARKVGVVLEVLDNNTLLIDGQTRRRKVNMVHVEPIGKSVQITKDAKTEDVAKVLEGAGFPVVLKKNSHSSASRQVKKRVMKKAVKSASK